MACRFTYTEVAGEDREFNVEKRGDIRVKFVWALDKSLKN